MEMQLVRVAFEKRCPRLAHLARRFVLVIVAMATILLPRTSYAWGRHRNEKMTIDEYRRIRFGTPGSFDVSDEIGPLSLASQTFSLSGSDAIGRQHDISISGHSLGVDRLVLDQMALSFRFGVVDHFSIGVPISIGGGPVNEPPPSGPDINTPHVAGGGAMIFGIGVSPGYEVNFGDSAFRFDAAVVGRVVMVPTNWETRDKHGQPVGADAVAAQIAFEPRVTVLPYAHRDFGAGFFGEMDAVHPENWACGVVVQLRWGRAG